MHHLWYWGLVRKEKEKGVERLVFDEDAVVGVVVVEDGVGDLDKEDSEDCDKGMCQWVEGKKKKGLEKKKAEVWKEKEKEKGMMGKCSNLRDLMGLRLLLLLLMMMLLL